MVLLLKLTLAPLLVALATLVARRWGPKVGGIVVGLPLSTGPIFLFLAIDQGLGFAERACIGILFGLVGLAAFALVYTAVSRYAGWGVSIILAAVAFFLVSASVGSYTLTGAVEAAIAAYAALILAAWLIRDPGRCDQVGIAMVGHLVSYDRRRHADLGDYSGGRTPWTHVQRNCRNVSRGQHCGHDIHTSPVWSRCCHRHGARQRSLMDRFRKLLPCDRIGAQAIWSRRLAWPRRTRHSGHHDIGALDRPLRSLTNEAGGDQIGSVGSTPDAAGQSGPPQSGSPALRRPSIRGSSASR